MPTNSGSNPIRRSGAILAVALSFTLLTPPASAATETVLHSFGNGSDGAAPLASLIDVNGTLYGTTWFGGAGSCADTFADTFTAGCGTVFSISPNGAEKVIHSFKGGRDGTYPLARLIDVNGILYGTTSKGGGTGCGGTGCGTVFSLTRDGREKVIYAFTGGSDGGSPMAGLTNVNGTLYGTTAGGGSCADPGGHCGTVFSISPSGTETVRYSFAGGVSKDGAAPQADLIQVREKLYGTTYGGGEWQQGTVFSITPGGAETVLYAFGSWALDGSSPMAGLVDVNGTLYGTVTYGAGGDGSVFSVSPRGREHTILEMGKNPMDGYVPVAPLIDVNGKLYGTDIWGGTNVAGGSVYSVDLKTHAETLVYSFCSQTNCSDGQHPSAGLIDVHGTLYGTTYGGGAHGGGSANGAGTVFAIRP